jgi:hypothetical protein
MELQPLFRRFDETIRLKRFDENAELREKRDRVLKRLRDNLRVTYRSFNQGSYDLGTGIKPTNGDYDIDVGVILNGIQIADYPDPLVPKGWVYEAVHGHTTRVTWRTNCITVQYQQGGEPIYHVDLPVFVQDAWGRLYLAVGKQHGRGLWQHDERQRFHELFQQRHQGEDAEQLRRVIRYLKRWKSQQFPVHGWAAPTGNALTVAAYTWFTPAKRQQGWDQTVQYADLAALRALVEAMRAHFSNRWTGQRYARRLSLPFPVQPHDDVFAKMTDQQMAEFEARLATLSEALSDAERRGDPAPLRRMFGDAFPLS